jgi:DNA-binding NarL/FixJ family response regulator
VDAATRGLTNGEAATELFVSRHTVESHVKHIFAKLGVRSRAEVAAVGARHLE